MKLTSKKELNLDTILSMVTEYQIFRWYIGKDFKLGQVMHSPFRKDDNPSFSVMATRSGRLYFTDFARTEYRGTVINFVELLFGIDYGQALAKIDSDLGLGIRGQKSDYEKVLAVYKEPKLEKQDTFIQVKAKPFDHSDLAYWNQYHIDLKELKEHNIYSVRKLYINRNQVTLNPHDLCFGYLVDESWKIYWPHAPKKDKWKSNVPIDRMWGMDTILPGCGKAIITKALKDMIVLKKFLPSVAATQNESTVSINNDNIFLLQKNCKEVYLNFDADTAGIVNCTFYNQFGFKWVNTPKEYKEKDFADLAKNHGMDAVIKHFKNKGII